MKKTFRIRFFGSHSDNLKSKIQNRKWWGILTITVAFSFCGSVVAAQQPKKLSRIGYLSPADTAAESNRFQGIRQALRELGYVDGKNIAFEHRYAEGDPGGGKLRLKLAAELVRVKVDVIVVTGGPAWVNAAKRATQTIPIVIGAGGTDPIKAGLVESFPRPGGNVTGFTSLGPELGGKRLELLKEAVPEVARVAVIYDPGLGTLDSLVVKPVLPIAARALALTLEPWFARDADELQKVFAALSKERPDGLYAVPSGPVMFANEKRIAEFALKSRIPSIYGRRDAVNAGGLMSYGADEADSYRRVAYFVDRILKGAKPADLPVEQPTKFEFVINLGTALEIGVTIPQSVLYRADRVVR